MPRKPRSSRRPIRKRRQRNFGQAHETVPPASRATEEMVLPPVGPIMGGPGAGAAPAPPPPSAEEARKAHIESLGRRMDLIVGMVAVLERDAANFHINLVIEPVTITNPIPGPGGRVSQIRQYVFHLAQVIYPPRPTG